MPKGLRWHVTPSTPAPRQPFAAGASAGASGPRASGAIEHQGFLRIQRDQCLLGRGEARRVKRPRVDVSHLTRLPIIPTAIFGEDHIVQDRAELLSVDPEHSNRSAKSKYTLLG